MAIILYVQASHCVCLQINPSDSSPTNERLCVWCVWMYSRLISSRQTYLPPLDTVCVCVCVLHPHILQNPCYNLWGPLTFLPFCLEPSTSNAWFIFLSKPTAVSPRGCPHVQLTSPSLLHLLSLSALFSVQMCVFRWDRLSMSVCVCVCVCVCVRLSSSSWEVFNPASIEPNELLNYLSLLPWWTVTVVNTKTTKERDLCV